MSTVFLDRVARELLSRHTHDLPDLRGATVLLPNYHVAQPLAHALGAAAKLPALLLPSMVTLNDWAQSVPLDAPTASDSQRGALLYQQLRKQKWFAQTDLWGMTQELLSLFDEITCSLTALPADAEAFSAAVQNAYQARENSVLQLEARLVFELWHAMQAGDELDTARAYQLRLAKLAAHATSPLYVLRTSDWDALEQRFLDEYARRAGVTVFDLRDIAAQVEKGSQNTTEISDVEADAAQGARPRFFAATSLEQEARAAAMQVRRWLADGKRNIAVVAQDRVVARRMRALLERAHILVTDETGWTFATLSVSTILDRWLTALQGDFYHHDLLDLLKSPFIFADMPASDRKAAVYQLEQLLRRHSVISGLDAFAALAAHGTSLHQLLSRLHQARALLDQGKKKTLADWLGALSESLGMLGIDTGLQQDAAGLQLMHALDRWQHELAADDGRHRFAEWRRWLALQLDSQTYRDTSIDSPVCLTHLAATRWRAFDAVLLLGCDAEHLPSIADGGRWFNDAVRAALGLTTLAARAARQRDDLLALLEMNGCTLVTWQKEKKGEQNLLSPYLQILRDGYEHACGDDLSAQHLDAWLAAENSRAIELPQPGLPAPCISAEFTPSSVSISAYNSLVACPYQFYARHVLRLNELDEVQEAIEKREYGERVHDILQRFHERFPQVSGRPAAVMEEALRQLSGEVFADLLAQDFAARAWLARWHKSLPAYLEWQQNNEARGWRYAGAERGFELALEGIRLRGRIDRSDMNEQERRVLDYKTQGAQTLRSKLKDPGEDVQLPCYAYAEGANEAAFVSIENGEVKSVEPPHDVAQLARLNAERLIGLMKHIREGAGLPANGTNAACALCEMRGVCRKGEW